VLLGWEGAVKFRNRFEVIRFVNGFEIWRTRVCAYNEPLSLNSSPPTKNANALTIWANKKICAKILFDKNRSSPSCLLSSSISTTDHAKRNRVRRRLMFEHLRRCTKTRRVFSTLVPRVRFVLSIIVRQSNYRYFLFIEHV